MTSEKSQTLEEMAAQEPVAGQAKKGGDTGPIIDDEIFPDKEFIQKEADPSAQEKIVPPVEEEADPPVPKTTQDDSMPTETSESIKREPIFGAFSSQTVAKVGTGTTSRKTIQKAYWFAEEGVGQDGNTAVFVQPLNNKNIPSGVKEEVPLSDFLARFSPELEFYQEQVFPQMKEMNSSLKRAEEQRDQGALYSAQFEFQAALDFDENNVRANFGLGLTYMERGEPEKAGDIFQRVVGLDAAFSPEHKHLFNEFGINLRKSKLHDQAVEYYTRALEMTQDDENLYYNIARAYFERGDKDDCIANLRKALAIKPDFEEVKKFIEYLEKEDG